MSTPQVTPIHLRDWHPTQLGPGTHHFRVDINQQADDIAIAWHACVVRGRADGPVFLVTAGVHGDEYEGMAGIRGFIADLDPATLRGTVIAIPVIHEAAYEAASRNSPIDDMNLARTFPGRADGTPTERIAHALRHHLLPLAGFYCDLHAGGTHYEIVPLTGYQLGPEDIRRTQYGACVAFDLPVIWGTPYHPGRSLSAAREAGVPAMYVEYLGGARCTPEDAQHCRQALRRVAGFLDVVDADYPRAFTGTCVEDPSEGAGHLQVQGVAGAKGYFEPECALWDRVRAGQTVGKVLDPLGHVLDTLCAEQNGRIVFMRRTRHVHEGDSCFCVIAAE